MERAYWVSTDLGPFRAGQVVILHEQDGWTRTGWLVELVDPPREAELTYPHLNVEMPE